MCFAAVLTYLQAYQCLMKYARVLIENCPQQATTLFVEYYTGRFRPRQIKVAEDDESAAPSGIALGAANAVQNFANLIPLSYRPGGASNDEQAARPNGRDAAPETEAENAPAADYAPPPPRTAFSSFIDHPDEFIVFLESCLEAPKISSANRKDLYTTLFEMYLHKASEKKGEQREEWEAKAKRLISGEDIPMESSDVLLLSDLSGFRDGSILVKEQAGLLFDIFRSYTSARDTRGAIRALKKYGPEEPQLYPAALSYLTSDARVLDEAGPDELAGVLEKIDRDGLMAPLQVIQTMTGHAKGGNSVATMGMVKPYLRSIIERERREIEANKRRIQGFRSETEGKRKELEELESKPAVFQATRCSDCGHTLDLPVVHFLCKHSFHQRCLRGGEGGECPVCERDNATIRALRERRRENAGKHGVFRAELEGSGDRFGTVAEWFGREVMDVEGVE